MISEAEMHRRAALVATRAYWNAYVACLNLQRANATLTVYPEKWYGRLKTERNDTNVVDFRKAKDGPA